MVTAVESNSILDAYEGGQVLFKIAQLASADHVSPRETVSNRRVNLNFEILIVSLRIHERNCPFHIPPPQANGS